jgi:hypothetical protein
MNVRAVDARIRRYVRWRLAVGRDFLLHGPTDHGSLPGQRRDVRQRQAGTEIRPACSGCLPRRRCVGGGGGGGRGKGGRCLPREKAGGVIGKREQVRCKQMKANQIETEEDMTKDRRGAGWDGIMEWNAILPRRDQREAVDED